MNDEVSSVDKASEVQGLNMIGNMERAEESKKEGFADIFNGLENMSNTSTLFDGIDDDEDAPPPLTSKQVAPVEKETKRAEDQSQQDPNHTQSQASEIDPFDMKNFPRSSLALSPAQTDDFITKTNTFQIANLRKLYDPKIEIERLKEELRIKNSEIQRMTLRIMAMNEKGHNESMIFNEDIHAGSSSYHLAFLFASPLVRRINSNIEMIMQLDYQNEILGIERQLKGVKHEVRYKVDVATLSNFRSVIVDAPFALHFTGHGIQNDQKALGSAYMQFKDKGDILLLEDENGMADYLFENDLKKLVEISKAGREFSHNYEVVFVSS